MTQLPRLANIRNTALVYAETGLTASAIRNQVRRKDKNGLAASGALVRCGHKLLIDLPVYGDWLAGRSAQ